MKRPLFAATYSLLLSSSLGLVSCQGAVDAGSGPAGGSAADPATGGTAASATGGAMTTGGTGAEPLPGELNAPFTRLTRAEYQATLLVAFDVAAPVSGIPDDKRVGPFTSNVQDQDSAHEFLLASEDLAAQLVPSRLPVCSGASASSCVTTSYLPALERLYRRPLTAPEAQYLTGVITSLEAAGVSAEAATRAMLVAALMSADFMFRASPLSGQPVRGRHLAEHLSYALIDAPPDGTLVGATAQAGGAELGTVLEQQALRLTTDARAVPVLARFLAQWLFVDVDAKLGDTGADFAASPLYAELLAFAQHALTANVTVKSLVNGTQGFVQKGNFAAYGLTASSGGGDVSPVTWSNRRGLIGQELFMDATRHPTVSRRPIFRGHLVRTSFLCQHIAPPPPNAVDMDADIQERTVDARCKACHQLMDPIGKAFSSLDLDVTGAAPPPFVAGAGEVAGEYADLPTLLDAIAESQIYADCFARNLLGFFLEQAPESVDAAAAADVASVVKAGGSFADTLAQVVVSLEARSRTSQPWCSGE